MHSWASLVLRIVAVAVVLSSTHDARASEPSRVVVIGGGAELDRAARVALSSWNVTVVSADGLAPEVADSEALAALAARFQGRGIAWFVGSSKGTVLYVYDADTKRTSSREISGSPPFDELGAASAALSLKTLLRTSDLAPPDERTLEPAPAPPKPRAVPPADPRPKRPHHDEPEEPHDRLEASLSLGARTLAASVMPRSGLGVRAFTGHATALGLAARADFGTARSVTGPTIDASLSTFDGSLSARLRLLPSSHVVVEPFAGFGAHHTHLSGTAKSSVAVSSERVDFSVDTGVFAGIRLSPRITLGGEVAASWMTRRQRYTVEGTPVLELQPLQGSATLAIVVGLL